MILLIDIVHIVVDNLDMDEMLIKDRSEDNPFPGAPVTACELRRSAIDTFKRALIADMDGDEDTRDYFLGVSDRLADRVNGQPTDEG